MKDLTGQKYGMLTVQEKGPVSTNGHQKWVCLCDCGNTKIVFGSNLVRLHTTSCGCYNRSVVTKHGLRKSNEYQSWKAMIQRCTNPRAAKFEHYGGAGVTVCESWLKSFASFYEDMGPRPTPEHSIDRINNSKGYYKENCRWATDAQQKQNQRRRRKVAA